MADTLNDYMYAYFQRVVTGNAALSGAINVSRAAVGVEATTANTSTTSSVNAPAAGATVASIANLTAGTYEVEVTSFITGTTVATLESDNMRFHIGATPAGVIINPVPGTTGATDVGSFSTRINLTATTTISVVAIGAATAGSVYKASIVAKKIGF
ncbi:hypothetical protein ACFY7C_36615 [Streptomyces sp. NPDC012769]|uniref:hypothetical protein n=1 Tax=Streptomyces sp. NPDC012769 TaxID=3364848 RepID=UPI003674EF6D